MRAFILIALILIAALVQLGGGGGSVLPIAKVTDAVYVYEKDETAIPAGVMSGMSRLNLERKITATFFDKDTKNGNGETPTQYRVSLAAAQEAGLPSLVVIAGGKAVKVVKSPTTEEQVMGAVQ